MILSAIGQIRRKITMAMNPMQRKANNYLLIGILGTLVVTGAIIALLLMQLNKVNTENMFIQYLYNEVKYGAKFDSQGEIVKLFGRVLIQAAEAPVKGLQYSGSPAGAVQIREGKGPGEGGGSRSCRSLLLGFLGSSLGLG